MTSIRIFGVGGGPDAGAVNEDGTFSVTGVFGPARIGVTGLPDGWIQTEVLYEGRNIAGKPISFETATWRRVCRSCSRTVSRP